MLDSKFNVTPTIKLLDMIAVRSVVDPNGRDIVNTPPRTGKSQMLAVWMPVWAFMVNPDLQIMIVSNGDDLAKEHSGKVRRIVQDNAEFLGYRIAADKAAVGRWLVEGHQGGMLAAGITSNIVGKGADILILDDVVGGASEADSPAHRKRVLTEYQGSLSTRVHPGGSQLLVMTRWHQEDLAGELLKLQPGKWNLTNVTAVGDPTVPDALEKDPGVAMVSALGYTPEDFADKRALVGERQWFAQFMGVPSNPEGGLVKREWLESHRIAVAPANPLLTVVSVDPSDSGTGDSCGVVATSLMGGNRVAMIADRSKPMTSDQWAREAVRLAIDVGASEIVVEGFSARETYTRVVKDAIKRAAVEHLTTTGEVMRPIKVSTWPPKGRPRVGDAQARSAALLQALEVGTCQLAGYFPDFEKRAIEWQSGQHQPDSLAALVIGHDVCVHAAGVEWDMAGPLSSPAAQVAQSVHNAAHGITRGGPVADMAAWRRRVS
ncbi:hypothetical protein C1S78_002915 [Mycolicibacterium mucogenicum DSM 44124]|uniref:Terminase n=2 Tax=Mycolicibacterium mucogenicum TaxID=56689 RepID=A0A8H2PJR8_MYCMU|nr:hypothetical protein C1S78_002915 [Mycolicibacterium mucogenicum DSM 44124]